MNHEQPIEFQLDIGNASNINAPLYLKAAQQRTQRIEPGSNPPTILSNSVFNSANF